MKSQNRRKFLKSSALFAMAVSVPALYACKDDESPEPPQGASGCQTTEDILGPFYKAGAPFRENIVPEGSNGTPLIIVGRVYSNCDTALENALVEIWNADEHGDYDTSDAYHFRGSYKTGADGAYRFETIIPGRYLNGNTYRPSHIHFRISAPGHRELVSQVYFQDDPFIASDPWASDQKAEERILAVEKDENDVDKVKFDIFLVDS
jgi:protocatechuate 3,4-dioxygenase beta subunit